MRSMARDSKMVIGKKRSFDEAFGLMIGIMRKRNYNCASALIEELPLNKFEPPPIGSCTRVRVTILFK